MLAVQFDRFGPPEVLALAERPDPIPGRGQVRVRVRVAGVSPVDLALRAGTSPTGGDLALPHIPGVDAAGVVDAIGEGVSGVKIGDAVFGAVDVAGLGGATAELAVLAFWAPKPDALTWEQAGASGTGVETATRVLDLLAVADGTTLLIDGASGGVGSLAIQLALARGVRVIATGSPQSQTFLASLGALPVPYGPGLAQRVRAAHGDARVDAALDVAGAGGLAELVALTGDPGAVVTIADFGASALGVQLSLGELGGQAGGQHGLAEAAALAQDGRFCPAIRATFPFAEAARGHELAGRGPHHGKVVLTAT